MTQFPNYISVGQAARQIGVSPSAINLWAKEGLLNFHLTPGGHRRFMMNEVVAFGMRRDEKKRAKMGNGNGNQE